MSATKRVAIMQPYFLPYIGYWQLMDNCDCFVVYDNIEYTKKGWINRNRFLLNGKAEVFTLPINKDSDHLHVNQRILADNFNINTLLRKWQSAYRKSPHFAEGMAIIEKATSSHDKNLFAYIYYSIQSIHRVLDMASELVISSSIDIDHTLKAQNKVLELCQALGATDFINPIGGIELYDREAFMARNIRLHFQNVKPYHYPQLNKEFIPHLSILDLFMFLGLENTKTMLGEMELC